MPKQTNYNVGIYVRLSKDDERLGESISVENQKLILTKYVAEQGRNLTDIYVDEGITGTSTKKRDGFNRMINDCEGGKIDLILTKEVSRFARNTVDTLNFTRSLSELNIGVIFMNDSIDTRDKDGADAKQERENDTQKPTGTAEKSFAAFAESRFISQARKIYTVAVLGVQTEFRLEKKLKPTATEIKSAAQMQA